MTAYTDFAAQNFGTWGVLIALLISAVWAVVKQFSTKSSRRRDSVHGSPATERYWRARLSEALSQVRETTASAEHTQFVARVTEARIMVEAHEARRRLGIGATGPAWMMVVFLGLLGAILGSVALTQRRPELAASAAVAIIAMALVELLALSITSITINRVNVLVAAGRAGRSDLVREDPWKVLREYDYARSAASGGATSSRSASRKTRKLEDKLKTSRRIRFERRLVGLTPWQSAPELPTGDQWRTAPASVPLNNDGSPKDPNHPSTGTPAAPLTKGTNDA